MRAQEGRDRAAPDAFVLPQEDEVPYGRRDPDGRVEEHGPGEPGEGEEAYIEVSGRSVEEGLQLDRPGRIGHDGVTGRPLDRGQRGEGGVQRVLGTLRVYCSVSEETSGRCVPAETSHSGRIAAIEAKKIR